MDGFSTFVGTLKQILSEDLGVEEAPTKIRAFQWAFPAFLDPLKEDITEQDSGAKARRRRYSGGAFSGGQPLPRGRYSSVCQNANGDDRETLCRELSAYAGSAIRQRVSVHDDLTNGSGSTDRGSLYLWFDDPEKQILGRMFSGELDAGIFLREDRPTSFGIRLGYRLKQVAIDNVVDLRLPATQRWFFETFRLGDGEFWRKPAGTNAQRFTDMLPTLYDTSLGGNEVTDAIGYCLRRMGAAGLIYPSARCNAAAIAENGTLSRWSGFNFVDFRHDSQESLSTLPNTFLDQAEWQLQFPWPRAKLVVIDPADRNAELLKQSWAVADIQQSHDEFYAHGGMLGGREVGAWTSANVDQTGSRIQADMATMQAEMVASAPADKAQSATPADRVIAFATRFDEIGALREAAAFYNLSQDLRARGHTRQSEELWQKALNALLVASRSKIAAVAQAAKFKLGWMHHAVTERHLAKRDARSAVRSSAVAIRMLEDATKGPMEEAAEIAKFELGRCLNDAGCAHLQARQRGRAHECFVRAIQLHRTAKDPGGDAELAITLGNDSECSLLRGDKSGALARAEEAAKCARGLVQANGVFAATRNAEGAYFHARGALVRALAARRRTAEAENCFRESLDVLLATMARNPDAEARLSQWPLQVVGGMQHLGGEKLSKSLMAITFERYRAAGREFRLAIT
ncbi:MAG: hypothetical protein AB7H66_16875 [Hyphomonadaceae bacterium]